MTRSIPKNASVAHAGEGAKLHAPSAARNAEAIAAFLAEHAPTSGSALELASGTGQHVTRFATTLPELHWHPTEIDPSRMRSIDAHVTEAGLTNVAPAQPLNATQAGWGVAQHPQDLIVLINLLHLINMPETLTLLSEVGKALAPGGTFILYGPFSRNGYMTSEGDQRFDAQLRTADPMIGYKDTVDIPRWLTAAGLTAEDPYEMPANNLAFVARKP